MKFCWEEKSEIEDSEDEKMKKKRKNSEKGLNNNKFNK